MTWWLLHPKVSPRGLRPQGGEDTHRPSETEPRVAADPAARSRIGPWGHSGSPLQENPMAGLVLVMIRGMQNTSPVPRTWVAAHTQDRGLCWPDLPGSSASLPVGAGPWGNSVRSAVKWRQRHPGPGSFALDMGACEELPGPPAGGTTGSVQAKAHQDTADKELA